jgi:hypothetical protein
MPAGTAFLSLAGEDVLLFSGLAWNPEATSPAIQAALRLAEKVLPTPEDQPN